MLNDGYLKNLFKIIEDWKMLQKQKYERFVKERNKKSAINAAKFNLEEAKKRYFKVAESKDANIPHRCEEYIEFCDNEGTYFGERLIYECALKGTCDGVCSHDKLKKNVEIRKLQYEEKLKSR